MRLSRGYLLLGAALLLLALIPFLRARSMAAAKVEDTLGILRVIKTEARRNWSNRPAPETLEVGNWRTAWKGAISLQQFARGVYDPGRVIRVSLADLPTDICPDLLARLALEKAQDAWVRVEVGATVLPAQPSLARRHELCASVQTLAVYFRF